MPSYYGSGTYGTGLYSASRTYALVGNMAPSISLTAQLSVVGKGYLAGGLVPSVTFSASLNRAISIKGDLSVAPVLSAKLDLGHLSGDMRPQIALGASLAVNRVWGGNLTPQVVFAATLTSGPLWQASQQCQAQWAESELCGA